MSIEGKGTDMVGVGKKAELDSQIEKLRNDLATRKNDSETLGSFSNFGNEASGGLTYNFKNGDAQSIEQQLQELENQKREIEEEEQRQLDESIANNKLMEELEINRQISEDVEANRQKIEIEKLEEEKNQKIKSLKESIKGFENDINAIERGGKFKISTVTDRGEVKEDSVDKLHKKIVEAEEQIRELEKMSFENFVKKDFAPILDTEEKQRKLDGSIANNKLMEELEINKQIIEDVEVNRQKIEIEKQRKLDEVPKEVDIPEIDSGLKVAPLSEKDKKIREILKKLDALRYEYQMELDRYTKEQKKMGKVSKFWKKITRGNQEPQRLVDLRNAYEDLQNEYTDLIV